MCRNAAASRPWTSAGGGVSAYPVTARWIGKSATRADEHRERRRILLPRPMAAPSSLKVQPRLPRGARIPQDARGAGGCLAAADSAVPGRPSGVLTVLGGCGQDNVVGLSRTQFLADVGFKLREYAVRLRRQIFSVPESRRQVVVTARPQDPAATIEPRKKERSSKNGSAVRKRRPRGRPDA
jgi:hypothetical protein